MTETEKLNQKIAELEKAILDANRWLVAGEGIDLLYHSDYANSTEDYSVFLIRKLLNKEAK